MVNQKRKKLQLTLMLSGVEFSDLPDKSGRTGSFFNTAITRFVSLRKKY